MFSFQPITVVRSRALGCDVLFVQDLETPIPMDLADLPIYTWSELGELLRIGLTRQELPAIHRAKTLFSGTIGESAPPVPVASSACPACGSVAVKGGVCSWCQATISGTVVAPPAPASGQLELF